ncbi:MAG TPA: hypothetical protein VFO49_06755 [Nocardioides sp.]|nr:hypothetical protein [Nocardioides sp.]
MKSTYYRLAVAVALGTALLLVLGAGALGIIGDGGRRDLMYAAVLVVGLIGSTLSRLRPKGMAMTLAAMSLAQILVTGIALLAQLADDASIPDLLALTAMFAGLFALSAWLFHRAAEGERRATVGTSA